MSKYSEDISKVHAIESREYSILKCVEELAELQEVLIKLVTKPRGIDELKRVGHLVEELGDVRVRTQIVIESFGLQDMVQERIKFKFKQLIDNK